MWMANVVLGIGGIILTLRTGEITASSFGLRHRTPGHWPAAPAAEKTTPQGTSQAPTASGRSTTETSGQEPSAETTTAREAGAR
jgi:hypothetical protein